MRIVFWGNGQRGVSCLAALRAAGIPIDWIVAHPRDEKSSAAIIAAASDENIECIQPNDPNRTEVCEALARRKPDLFVLAGYGKILAPELIQVPSIMAINTHAGRLPAMRGSSPMNWALIRGDTSFSLSIIRVAAGVDAGDVLLERSFDIGPNDSIATLHETANRVFPEMLVESIRRIERGDCSGRAQDSQSAAYFPLRFPEDGMILWDQLTADQIHNRIRALTDPYPGAFTFHRGNKVRLLASEATGLLFFGEPGRIYRVTPKGMLVCASDRSLWITRAAYADGRTGFFDEVQRYDTLATVREAAMRWYESGAKT